MYAPSSSISAAMDPLSSVLAGWKSSSEKVGISVEQGRRSSNAQNTPLLDQHRHVKGNHQFSVCDFCLCSLHLQTGYKMEGCNPVWECAGEANGLLITEAKLKVTQLARGSCPLERSKCKKSVSSLGTPRWPVLDCIVLTRSTCHSLNRAMCFSGPWEGFTGVEGNDEAES